MSDSLTPQDVPAPAERAMQRYGKTARNSGVVAYATGPDYIVVQFRKGKTYRYSYAVAGWHHVERMKLLAAAGRGLSTYISQHVHDLYDRDR
jgi:hypothetical protein